LRRLLSMVLIFIVCIVFVSCSPKIPTGIEHKEFYNDMVSSVRGMESNLKNIETLSFESNVCKNIFKYFKDDVWDDKNRDDKYNWLKKYIKSGLNEKEKEVLINMVFLIDNFNMYINYQQENSVKVLKDKLIDPENAYSEDLRFQIDKVLKMLDLKYEIN